MPTEHTFPSVDQAMQYVQDHGRETCTKFVKNHGTKDFLQKVDIFRRFIIFFLFFGSLFYNNPHVSIIS